MRAIYLAGKELKENSEILLEGNDHHHLVNVLRIKKDEAILVLNGLGLKANSTVREINKKNIVLSINSIKTESRSQNLSLGLCVPKRDFLESALRSAVELGVGDLYLFESEYSQRYEINESRIQKILKSSYEQSNNPFELRVHPQRPLRELKSFNNVVYFNSQSEQKKDYNGLGLVLIGPEGGFSAEELDFLGSLTNSHEVSLSDKPIMRSVTAIPFAFGYLMH